MKKVLVIITALFFIAIAFVTMLPPGEITVEDIYSSFSPRTDTMEPAANETVLIDSPETEGDDKVQVTSQETKSDDKVEVDYYIIVESFRDLTLAQKKAAKLRNDVNGSIIILPPTPAGYYRISCGKYSTLEEAKSAVKSIRANISSDAWISPVKK